MLRLYQHKDNIMAKNRTSGSEGLSADKKKSIGLGNLIGVMINKMNPNRKKIKPVTTSIGIRG